MTPLKWKKRDYTVKVRRAAWCVRESTEAAGPSFRQLAGSTLETTTTSLKDLIGKLCWDRCLWNGCTVTRAMSLLVDWAYMEGMDKWKSCVIGQGQ